jgi:hypothetical protein
MESEHIEQTLNDAVRKVVWDDYKPAEYLADWVGGTMLSEDWDPLQMLQFELMAFSARKQNGFNLPTEQD